MTTEFVKASNLTVRQPFSLIENKGLIARLGEELSRAANELTHDPRGFLGGLFSPADTKDQKRRRLIYFGLGLALLAHAAMLVVMVVAGWHRILEAPKVADLAPEVYWVPPESRIVPGKSTAPRGGESEHVSGGGGQQDPTPPTAGLKPKSFPMLPMVRANPPLSENPVALPMMPTIQGPAEPPPPPGSALGVQNGKPGEFSTGTGTGGGLGGVEGTGAGSQSGPGGPRGGKGGLGSPDGGKIEGTANGIASLNYNAPKPAGFVPMRWIYRPTPVVTPEAQANKPSGTVLVIATFRSDGTISDIEIKNTVPFMTESAIDALKRSKFRPASINGIPITMFRVPVRVNIELTGHP